MAPHVASVYEPLTNEDWVDFLKISKPNGSRIKGALCRNCKKMITTVSRKRLEAHRKSCPAKNSANYKSEKSDMDESETAELKNTLDEDLALFFYTASIAFTQIENKYLKRFIKRVQFFPVNYEPPCRETLGTKLLDKVHSKIVEKKKEILEGTDGVLLVDGWRNKSTNRKYLVFSVRNINTPQTFLTFFDISIEKETGQNLKDRIDEAIEKAKKDYDCNIYAIITDNDSKIVLGAKLAKHGSLIRSSCSSHSGNLLIKVFITPDLLNSLREILSAYREPKLDRLLESKKGSSKLQNFPDTRFCYLRDTCSSILKNLRYMRELADVEDIGLSESVIKTVKDDEFKTKITAIVENLDPICVLINTCQHSKCTVADSTQLWLSLELPTHDYDDVIAARIEKAVQAVGYAANLLHPSYKGQLLNAEQRRRADVFLDEYLVDEAKQELLQYLDDENYRVCAERFDDPVAYWLYIKNVNQFPNLAVPAMNLMIIPGSTALLEGLFSNWSYVHNLYRNRLGHLKSSNLLDIYYSSKNDLYCEDTIQELMLIEDEDKINNEDEMQY